MVELTWSKVYADQAKNWDEGGFVHFRKDVNDVLSRWFTENPKWTLFEVGCGTGKTLEFLHRHGASPDEYQGIDITPEFIEVCTERFLSNYEYPPVITFKEYDWFDLKIINDGWDVVVAIDVLQHLADWKKALERMAFFARERVLICVRTTAGKTFDESGDHVKLRINQIELRDACQNYGKVRWFKTRTFGGRKVKSIYIIDVT